MKYHKSCVSQIKHRYLDLIWDSTDLLLKDISEWVFLWSVKGCVGQFDLIQLYALFIILYNYLLYTYIYAYHWYTILQYDEVY